MNAALTATDPSNAFVSCPAGVLGRGPKERFPWSTLTRVALAAALSAGAGVAAAQSAQAGSGVVPYSAGGPSYLEVVGSGGVRIDAAPVANGVDSNPLLNVGAGANPAQAAQPQAGPPITDGDVGRVSNVPAPAALVAGQRTALAQPAGQTSGTYTQYQGSNNYNNGAAMPRAAGPVPANPTAPGGAMGSLEVDQLPSPSLPRSNQSGQAEQGDDAPKRPDIPKEVINRLSPATSQELREILEALYERQGAAVTPIRPGSVNKAVRYEVDLSPGATPPVVRVAKGIGTTVNFVDQAGNPWPIVFARNFYKEADSVVQMAPHVLSVAAQSPHLTGSVGVMLQGLTTPVNFIVTPAQDAGDYRVDLVIPGLSPEAHGTAGGMLQSSRPSLGGSTGSTDLKEFLYGATPQGAKRLKVTGDYAEQANTRAWQTKNGQLVLRTAALVISPAWSERMPALDGTAVYSLPGTPVVRVSVDGRETTFMVDGLTPESFDTSSQAAKAFGGGDPGAQATAREFQGDAK